MLCDPLKRFRIIYSSPSPSKIVQSCVADPDPNGSASFRKSDPERHQSENPDPYQSKHSGAVKAQNRANASLRGPRMLTIEA
jgi:hypothetical protein